MENDYNVNKGHKEEKISATEWLEKHKIWFTTALSFCLTFASIMVSVASCSITRYQTVLQEETINNMDLEKQPYFSVENRYVESDGTYTYVIKNTGGEIRYVNIYVIPYLYIERCKNGEYEPIQYAFIHLPGFYADGKIRLSENELFAFKDRLLLNDMGEYEQADNLFRHCVSYDNLQNTKSKMYSQLVYMLQISYVNYKNEYKTERIMLTRSSDLSNRVEGNPILNIDMSQKYKLDNATEIYDVDSLNLSPEEVRQSCELIIDDLREQFGQTQEAEKYRNN